VRVAGQDYQLELIDTAGQDELSIVSQSHSMNLDGYVLVYSVTSEKRFLLTYFILFHLLTDYMLGSLHCECHSSNPEELSQGYG